MSDALRPVADPLEAQRTGMQLLVDFLGLDQTFYYRAEREANGWAHVVEHDCPRKPDIPMRVGRRTQQEFGATVFAGLERGEPVVVPDVTMLVGLTPEQRANYQAAKLRAFVVAPVVKEGRYVAGVSAQSASAREWTARDVAIVREVAERTWTAAERARAEAALRERAAWLTGQKEAFQAAIDGAAIQDSLGILVRTVRDQGGGDLRCAFYMADAGGAELRHVTGMPEPYALCVDGFRVGPDSLACGLAVHTGQPVITSDVTKEPRWASWLWLAEQYGYRAVWSSRSRPRRARSSELLPCTTESRARRRRATTSWPPS